MESAVGATSDVKGRGDGRVLLVKDDVDNNGLWIVNVLGLLEVCYGGLFIFYFEVVDEEAATRAVAMVVGATGV